MAVRSQATSGYFFASPPGVAITMVVVVVDASLTSWCSNQLDISIWL